MKKTLMLILGSTLLFAGCSASQPKSSNDNSTNTTNSSTTDNTNQTYTLADVAKHSTRSDCWLAVDGGVYDVTKFIPQHPGGSEILKGCGNDASSLFHGQPKHAEQAANMLKTLKIGTLRQ